MLRDKNSRGAALLLITFAALLSCATQVSSTTETTQPDSTATSDSTPTSESPASSDSTPTSESPASSDSTPTSESITTSDSTTTSESSATSDSTATSDSITPPTPIPNKKLQLHFISDLGYNIFPINNNMELCQVTTGELTDGCFGGYGRLATYMSDSKSDQDIWLNAGNMLNGNLFKILKFDTIIDATNALQFDVVAAEPEMFRYGVQAVEDVYMEGLKDVLVSFNYNETPTKLIQKAGCKIAMIGFVEKEKTDAMNIAGLMISDEKEYIQKQAESLQAGDIDSIIVVGSTSRDKAVEIAKISGVNLVIYSGGNAQDTSDNNYVWESISKSNDEVAYIASLNSDTTKPESFFQVGTISMTITDGCIISDTTFEPIEDYGQLNMSDSALEKTVSTLEDLEGVLTNTPVVLTGANALCQLGECLLGNLVTDAIMAAISTEEAASTSEQPVTFSIFPTWTLIQNVSLTGEIKTADLYGLFEDDCYIYSVTMTGQQVKEMFEEAVSDYQSADAPMENFLQVSNYLHTTYYMKKDVGQRVHEVQIFDVTDTPQFIVIDESTTYNVAVPKFVLEGEQFTFVKLGSLNTMFHKVTFLNALKDYISWKGSLQNSGLPIIPTVGERIKFSEAETYPENTCYNNTGEVIIITLVVIGVLAGGGFAVWKYLYPKFRARRGSRIALIA